MAGKESDGGRPSDASQPSKQPTETKIAPSPRAEAVSPRSGTAAAEVGRRSETAAGEARAPSKATSETRERGLSAMSKAEDRTPADTSETTVRRSEATPAAEEKRSRALDGMTNPADRIDRDALKSDRPEGSLTADKLATARMERAEANARVKEFGEQMKHGGDAPAAELHNKATAEAITKRAEVNRIEIEAARLRNEGASPTDKLAAARREQQTADTRVKESADNRSADDNDRPHDPQDDHTRATAEAIEKRAEVNRLETAEARRRTEGEGHEPDGPSEKAEEGSPSDSPPASTAEKESHDGGHSPESGETPTDKAEEAPEHSRPEASQSGTEHTATESHDKAASDRGGDDRPTSHAETVRSSSERAELSRQATTEQAATERATVEQASVAADRGDAGSSSTGPEFPSMKAAGPHEMRIGDTRRSDVDSYIQAKEIERLAPPAGSPGETSDTPGGDALDAAEAVSDTYGRVRDGHRPLYDDAAHDFIDDHTPKADSSELYGTVPENPSGTPVYENAGVKYVMRPESTNAADVPHAQRVEATPEIVRQENGVTERSTERTFIDPHGQTTHERTATRTYPRATERQPRADAPPADRAVSSRPADLTTRKGAIDHAPGSLRHVTITDSRGKTPEALSRFASPEPESAAIAPLAPIDGERPVSDSTEKPASTGVAEVEAARIAADEEHRRRTLAWHDMEQAIAAYQDSNPEETITVRVVDRHRIPSRKGESR